ncbi:MAG: PorP/SprF family type IX secretion system membrane protein [Bacteroidia bacterium]|nr:PorP/SprF family type IX secretion system membrane protein [Bacteroidia bacterium]
MRNRLLIFSLFLLAARISFSQDMYFNCFQRALLYNNPAFTGTSGQLRVQTAGNYLWPGSVNYFIGYGSVDHYLGGRSSLGLTYSYQNENSFYLKYDCGISYAQRFFLFKKKLIFQPAVRTSYCQSKVNWGSQQYRTEVDSLKGFVNEPIEVPGLSKKSNLDLSAGFLLYTKQFYFGYSVLHITQPDEGMLASSKLPMRMGIQTAYQIALDKQWMLIPALQYTKQEDLQFGSVGISCMYKKWIAGLNYSTNRSLSISAGWQNERFKAGISHSVFLKGVPYSATYGAYELNLSFLFFNQDKEKKFISIQGF